MSERVNPQMRRQAARILALGGAVVADAVFDRADLAVAVEQVASDNGAAFSGFWLEAPRAHMAQRIESRRGDPSDATPDVLDLQMKKGVGPDGWVKLNSARAREIVAAEALAALR